MTEKAQRPRINQEMDEMIQRRFTLLVKPPGQGRGFAGKNATVIEVQTTFGAILHDVVKERIRKESREGARPRVLPQKGARDLGSHPRGEVLANRERLRCEMRRAQQRIPGVHYDL